MRIESEREENELKNEKFNRGISNVLSWTKKALFSVLSYIGRKCASISTSHTRNYIMSLNKCGMHDNSKNFNMNTTVDFLDDIMEDYAKKEEKAYKSVARDLNALKDLIINRKK